MCHHTRGHLASPGNTSLPASVHREVMQGEDPPQQAAASNGDGFEGTVGVTSEET